MLTVQDFPAFFREVHGVYPFPWQYRLLQQVAASDSGHWPATLDLPTGSGKTAAIDIALFHLALQSQLGTARRSPVRVAFVVDRRLIVDDAHTRALQLQQSLERALAEDIARPTSARVARALKALAGNGPPLVVRRLRGGIPREDDWARTPSQPTVLCSTVDQIGSRLLFRGYGVSDSMKPVHAGLIGSDCLILLDEAHLAEPFRQTLDWVKRYRGGDWREAKFAAPWGMTLLTATPGEVDPDAFRLDNEQDGRHPVLQRRLQARKPARLRLENDEAARQASFVEEVQRALDSGAEAVGVVLNRVARARDLFERIRGVLASEQVEVILLIGANRPAQRDVLAERLRAVRTGAPRPLARRLVVVSTQCIEAGVDIDLDALFTEAAPLDALRQRFGRLNRDGRPVDVAAAIVATREEVGARADDKVYGAAIRKAWQALVAAAEAPGAPAGARARRAGRGAAAEPAVDFGIAHFAVPMAIETMTSKVDAPVLMPAHLDLLSQTAPIPGADLEIALYLHGPQRQPDAVSVVWRADLVADDRPEDVARRLALIPPLAGEAIGLPVWAVRRWLNGADSRIDALADLPAPPDDEVIADRSQRPRRAIRWSAGNDDARWLRAEEVRPGDTLVVPASYGGIDSFGWNVACSKDAEDLADAAAAPNAGRRFAVRVAPGLLGASVSLSPDQLAQRLAELRAEPWSEVCSALLRLPLPEAMALQLKRLASARRYRGHPRVELVWDAYGAGLDGAPRGVVFVAAQGLVEPQLIAAADGYGFSASTEDDRSGSAPGFAQSLQQHSAEVEAQAAAFSASAGLPSEWIADLKLAGWLHDQGKRDARFQRWMHHGDPLGADPDDEQSVLAKSGRPLQLSARDKAGLPPHWRHEACSVRLARTSERLATAYDPELVLWLVGTHHGYGRPFFPHSDPDEVAPEVGPQSPAFDWNGHDWPTLFERLKARYGAWELARLEAILRLADHRASEAAASNDGEGA